MVSKKRKRESRAASRAAQCESRNAEIRSCNRERYRTRRDAAAFAGHDEGKEADRTDESLVDRLERLDRTLEIEPTNEQKKLEIYDECSSRLSNAWLEETVCCVCDCLHPRRDILFKRLVDNPILVKRMKERLIPPPSLPQRLYEEYDAGPLCSLLDHTMVSKLGIDVSSGVAVVGQFCRPCHGSLMSSRVKGAPKFAIANGLYIGRLPEVFADTTSTENAMLNLGQPTHSLSVVRGGQHKTLRAHSYVFRANPSTPATMLPRDVVAEGTIKVRIVGAMTEQQKVAVMKKYQVRTDRIRQQADWYAEYNCVHQALARSSSPAVSQLRLSQDAARELGQTCVVVDQCSAGGYSATAGGVLDSSTWRFNAPVPSHDACQENEETEMQEAISLISDFVEDNAVDQCLFEAHRDVVVFRSSEFLSDFDPKFWACSFCELFPFGRGGLDESRRVAIGLEEYVKYLLRLSSRRFMRHQSFSLVAFDVIARHRGINAVSLKVKMTPAVARRASTVSREAVIAQAEYQDARLRALKGICAMPERPPRDENYVSLQAGIDAGMRAMWGSNQERTRERSNLLAMSQAFGQPSLFFTISPSSSSSLRIGALAGDIDPRLFDGEADRLHECVQYSRAVLGRIASGSPVACARYFDEVMRIVIDVVLGWDVDAGMSRDGGGLFGHTRAFTAMVESQNSTGDLHAHMLIWIHGLPRTITQYYSKCQEDAFRARLASYAGGIAKVELPIACEDKCPRCGDGSVSVVKPDRGAFKKPAKDSNPPTTAKCDACGSAFGGDQFIRASIESQLAAGEELLSTDRVHYETSRVQPLRLSRSPGDPAALMLCAALLSFQHHRWYHSSSCFKPSKRTPDGKVCRMFFPKEVRSSTVLSEDGGLELKRPIGHDYVNPYIPEIAVVFKSNHDVKFLAAGEGLAKAHYMMKYATKEQKAIENQAVLHLNAFDKAAGRHGGSGDSLDAGKKVIMSMISSLSNPQEVAGPLAGLHLIRGSAVYASHGFQSLFMPTVLDALHDRAMSLPLVRTDNGRRYTYTNVFEEYVQRPVELEETSLMSYLRNYEKVKATTGASVRRRELSVVVTVFGDQLPNINDPDLSSRDEQRYCTAMMVLFKPFRSRQDVPDDDKIVEEFQEWWEKSASNDAREFSENTMDAFTSRRFVSERKDESVEYFRSCNDKQDNADATMYHEHEDAFSDSFESVDEEDHDEGPLLTTALPTSHNLLTVKNAENSVKLSAALLSNVSALAAMEYTTDSVLVEDELVGPCNQPACPTRVVAVDDPSLEPIWRSPDERLIAESSSTSTMDIRSVSERFNLNRKQHQAFAAAGAALLREFRGDVQERFCGFLGGLPGAGKSQVIKALQALAEAWKRPRSVKTIAYQGIAAQVANGETIHKCFGWNLKGDPRKWKPNQGMLESFSHVKLMILDEVSSTDVALIGRIDDCLRKCTGNNVLFGGIHFLFVGDWLQQLPVAGTPAFASEVSPDTNDSAYAFAVKGVKAYEQITSVTMLEENMRHRSDERWKQILSKWRYAQYDPCDVAYVNEVCSLTDWQSVGRDHGEEFTFCPILVTSNTLRVEFNLEGIREHCSSRGVIWHRFPATVKSKHGLSPSLRRGLTTLRDDKSGGLPMTLDMAIGIPVQCTKNVSRELKLSNGSIAQVCGFQFGLCDTVTETCDHVSNARMQHHSTLPEAVYIKLRGYEDVRFDPKLPRGIVGVAPFTQKGVRIKLPHRQFSLEVEQIPLVPAFSITVDKCQGLTIESMILGPVRHHSRRSPQRTALYVAVTRVKTIKRLYLMEKLTPEFLAYFHPTEEALAETIRLCELDPSRSS